MSSMRNTYYVSVINKIKRTAVSLSAIMTMVIFGFMLSGTAVNCSLASLGQEHKNAAQEVLNGILGKVKNKINQLTNQQVNNIDILKIIINTHCQSEPTLIMTDNIDKYLYDMTNKQQNRVIVKKYIVSIFEKRYFGDLCCKRVVAWNRNMWLTTQKLIKELPTDKVNISAIFLQKFLRNMFRDSSFDLTLLQNKKLPTEAYKNYCYNKQLRINTQILKNAITNGFPVAAKRIDAIFNNYIVNMFVYVDYHNVEWVKLLNDLLINLNNCDKTKNGETIKEKLQSMQLDDKIKIVTALNKALDLGLDIKIEPLVNIISSEELAKKLLETDEGRTCYKEIYGLHSTEFPFDGLYVKGALCYNCGSFSVGIGGRLVPPVLHERKEINSLIAQKIIIRKSFWFHKASKEDKCKMLFTRIQNVLQRDYLKLSKSFKGIDIQKSIGLLKILLKACHYFYEDENTVLDFMRAMTTIDGGSLESILQVLQETDSELIIRQVMKSSKDSKISFPDLAKDERSHNAIIKTIKKELKGSKEATEMSVSSDNNHQENQTKTCGQSMLSCNNIDDEICAFRSQLKSLCVGEETINLLCSKAYNSSIKLGLGYISFGKIFRCNINIEFGASFVNTLFDKIRQSGKK